MPTAGAEGYEQLIQCPYDKAHEIRKGRMQFHLEKCRRNFPTTQFVDCPFNKAHLIPQQELGFHTEEECDSRASWERFSHGSTVQCPVRDLVPVNAGSIPDSEESWDTFVATGSVLNTIKADAETKPIIRMRQVASKAERKKFRKQEVLRHSAIKEAEKEVHRNQDTHSDVSDTILIPPEPLRKPTLQPELIQYAKQDPLQAAAQMSKQFRTLDLNMKSPKGETAPSDTSSMINGPPSEYEASSTSHKIPFSYASATRPAAGRPPSALSNISTPSSSVSMMTAQTSHRAPNSSISRPSTANSFATAYQGGSSSRPQSVMSNSSDGSITLSDFTSKRAPNSTAPRQSTAMSIASSVASFNRMTADEDGFCQIPIPGLGRGRRKPDQ